MKKILFLIFAVIAFQNMAMADNSKKEVNDFIQKVANENKEPIKQLIAVATAARKGNTLAQCALGICFYSGKYGAADYKKAFTWFSKAAKKDFPEAQFFVGICYFYGRGVYKSTDQAMVWWNKAAKKGNQDAINILKIINK